jgi:hypothetical protein
LNFEAIAYRNGHTYKSDRCNCWLCIQLLKQIGWDGKWIVCWVLAMMILVWVLFGMGGDVGVLFVEDAGNVGSNVVVDYRLIVFTYNVDTAFFG